MNKEFERMAEEKPVKKTDWSGSPRRRNPELYFGQIWVDHKLHDTVRLFAEWEKNSIKAAFYQLVSIYKKIGFEEVCDSAEYTFSIPRLIFPAS